MSLGNKISLMKSFIMLSQICSFVLFVKPSLLIILLCSSRLRVWFCYPDAYRLGFPDKKEACLTVRTVSEFTIFSNKTELVTIARMTLSGTAFISERHWKQTGWWVLLIFCYDLQGLIWRNTLLQSMTNLKDISSNHLRICGVNCWIWLHETGY